MKMSARPQSLELQEYDRKIFVILLSDLTKIFYREKGSMIHLDFNFSHVKDCLAALFDLLQQRRIIE